MDPEVYINLGDTSQSEGNFKQAIPGFISAHFLPQKRLETNSQKGLLITILATPIILSMTSKKKSKTISRLSSSRKRFKIKALKELFIAALAMLITFSVILKQQSCSITRPLASQKKLKTNN